MQSQKLMISGEMIAGNAEIKSFPKLVRKDLESKRFLQKEADFWISEISSLIDQDTQSRRVLDKIAEYKKKYPL